MLQLHVACHGSAPPSRHVTVAVRALFFYAHNAAAPGKLLRGARWMRAWRFKV